jgi:cell division protein FtsW
MNSKPALWIALPVALLFSLGLLMIFNTSAAEILDRSLPISTHAALLKQLLYGGIGILAGWFVYTQGYQRWLTWSIPLTVVCTFLLICVFIPPIGQTINGSRRWIGIAGYTVQPSECAKLLIPLAFIRWVVQQQETISWRSFLKVMVLLSLPIGLILVEPDTGATVTIVLTLLVLLILSRIRWTYWSIPLFILCVGGTVIASQMSHVRDRFRIYLHPELDLRGKGHQPYQAKIAAGSGRLFGRGIGESLQKLNYLPEARSDYIAAIFAEECGFIGVCVLIALYLLLTFTGIYTAFHASDRAAFLIAATFTFLISIQAFINLGVVSGLLPSKGMTLPFFSQGGSSLVINFIAIFVLFDISRNKRSFL